jgi:hypothetical protein
MYLDELKVLHAGGPHYYETTPEKRAYWESYNRGVRRKNAVKRALLRIPLVRPLNNRFKLFELWQPVPLDETRRGHVESRIEDGARHWSTPE